MDWPMPSTYVMGWGLVSKVLAQLSQDRATSCNQTLLSVGKRTVPTSTEEYPRHTNLASTQWEPEVMDAWIKEPADSQCRTVADPFFVPENGK